MYPHLLHRLFVRFSIFCSIGSRNLLVIMSYGEHDDTQKLAFTLNALNKGDPFASVHDVPDAVRKAIEWQSERTPTQVLHERELIIAQLEKVAKTLRQPPQ